MQAKKVKQPKPAKQQATTKVAAKKFADRHASHLEITHGGCDYIACVLNPRTGPLARVPYGFPIRSRTLRVKATGTFTSDGTIAGSVPFVAVNPWRLIASDGGGVIYSTATYQGLSSGAPDSGAAGVIVSGSNSDYTLASLNNENIQFRLVGASLEVSATSGALTRQGSLVVFTEPGHENFVTQFGGAVVGTSYDNISSYEGNRVRAVPMSDKVERTIWGVPEKPSEAEWLSYFDLAENTSYLVTAGLTSQQANDFAANMSETAPWYNFNMIAYALGSTTGGVGGTAGTFRYEVHGVFEISGRSITGKGAGVSDPVAYQAAANYIQRTPNSTQIGGDYKDVLRYLGQQLGVVTPSGDVNWKGVASTATAAAALL